MLVYNPTGSPAPKNAATAPTVNEPNAAVTASRGWVRRHSSARMATTASPNAASGHVRSVRSTASSAAPGTSTATSAQSRQTRAGGAGARGSANSDRAALLISCRAYATRAGRGIGHKYDVLVDSSAG